MPQEIQYRYCEQSGRRVTPLEIEEMHDSLHTVWWLCPACGDWHAEFSEQRKIPTVKKSTRH